MTSEQKILIKELMEQPETVAALLALTGRLVSALEREVITCNSDNEKELVRRKAQAEGAHKLLYQLTAQLKPSQAEKKPRE